jgi:hypothetical protein
MTSRLVLVGMVAALGISIPTWPEIQGCMLSIHSWTAARLADLDASTSRYEDPPIAVLPLHPRARRSFELIEPDHHVSVVADELNRLAEGLELPAGIGPFCPQGVSVVRQPSPILRSCRDSAVVPTLDLVQCEQIRGLLEESRPSKAELNRIASRTASQPSISDAPVAACPSPPATREPPAPGVDSPPVESDGIKVAIVEMDPVSSLDDASTAVGIELGRFAEGIDLGSERAGPRGDERLAFTPIDVAASAQPSLADEINRAADGSIVASTAVTGKFHQPAPRSGRPLLIPVAITSPRRHAPIGPLSEVARAMRLTRAAAHAWMTVMAGPTSVRISAR